VFVTVVASIQYRALADKASDAFYKLSNTRAQIQSYVFDGINLTLKVTMFVIIMKLKESCSLRICPMDPYLLGKK